MSYIKMTASFIVLFNDKIMRNVFIKRLTIFSLLVSMAGWVNAQEIKIHSHNDYCQRVPFYQAYANGLSSIEADIFIVSKDELRVAHTAGELSSAPTLEEAYLDPLVALFKKNKNKAWADSDEILTLLIDLKTPATPTLDDLVSKLKLHPEVFDPSVNPYAVRVVISGNRPEADHFKDYPGFISFDGDRTDYTKEQLERIAMISLNLRDYTQWNGKGRLIDPELAALTNVITKVHALHKPIRFWGTPDGVTAWNTFHTLGVDYINTDQPEACSAFFYDFQKKTYRINANANQLENDNALAKRLDKTTAGFQGFHTKELQLSKRIELYEPTFLNDGKETKIKNVIFLIGDGMGLAAVCAADAVNQGLSLLKLKQIGLQRTDSEDAYTTDSAAGGSALATGVKHKNRHISMAPDGTVHSSLTDWFYEKGYACGVVTSGNLADATPAAFYGHATERDNSDDLTNWLLDGKLSLLTGSGMSVFTHRKDGKDLLGELKSKVHYTIQTDVDEMNRSKGKVICVDERLDLAATEKTLPLLAKATHEAIQKLQETHPKGFFLMVEGAKVDYAGHANSLPGTVMEMLSFDLAVQEALKFADSNGETLVVVTADHETGGVTLVDGDKEKASVTVQYMTDDHTPIMVPVYIYGPKSNRFTGIYPNTEIPRRILTAVGIN